MENIGLAKNYKLLLWYWAENNGNFFFGKVPLVLHTESNSTLRNGNCAWMPHPIIRKNILPLNLKKLGS
jgi:hypothetical protein